MIFNGNRLRLKILMAIAVLLVLYCSANLYHWAVVWKYPALYYFPEHSITVFDAETNKPIQGVIALYGYELDPMFSSSDWITPFMDFFGMALYLPYQNLYNKLTHSTIGWNSSCLIHLSESESDAAGLIRIPSYGPIHRLRNHYFFSSHSPQAFLIKEGYKIKALQQALDISNTPWKYIPPWADAKIFMAKQSSFRERAEPSVLDVYCFMQRLSRGRIAPKQIVPNSFNVLSIMLEAEKHE